MFRNDSAKLTKIKEDAKVVRDCYHSNVQSYLLKFPTESKEKFDFRKHKHFSKFTNFTSSAINAMQGVALKKQPSVEDESLHGIPEQIADVMLNLGTDSVCYLFVDAPKLEDGQRENEGKINYISVSRVIGDPLKDGLGNIIDFTFEGDETLKTGEGDDLKYEDVKYRKRVYVEDGKSYGVKYQDKNGKWENVYDWPYGDMEGIPVAEIDIRTAGKHPFEDIANDNLWYYNLESDERNVIHMICSPYTMFFGQVVEDKQASGGSPAQVYIGADRAHRFNDKQKEGIEIAEAEGKGVSHATDKLKSSADIITRMSVSVLTNTNYKTATEANDAQSKSLGFLPYVVMSVENAFNIAIHYLGEFRGAPYSSGVEMNKQFTMTEYNEAKLGYAKFLYEKGILTKDSMLDISKKADIIGSKIVNNEEIQKAEEAEGDYL